MAEKEKAKVINNPSLFNDKMRIKLIDGQQGHIVSDRLVAQATEFRNGPSEPHNGPMSIEANLNGKEDAEDLISYLSKLIGKLPIGKKEKKSSTAKKLDNMLKDKEPLLDLMKVAKEKGVTQEKLIEHLREYQFRFVATDIVTDIASKEMITLKDKHIEEKYQWMVRLAKEAKNPMNDKYDWRLVFGIKLVGGKVDKVQVYLWGKYEKTWSIEWGKRDLMNYKKVEKVYFFPEFMDYDMRKKWRVENRKILHNPAHVPSSFYTKWLPYVGNLDNPNPKTKQ